MRLSPDETIIASEKLRDYILDSSHPDGGSKARFLAAMGYEQVNWKTLEKDLREQHLTIEASPGKQSIYGTKYEIAGPLVGPNGERKWVRSIWMIRKGEKASRFITLIPEEIR